MHRTACETQQQTLSRLIKATDNEHPVTITYVKADGTETIRTIEIYDIQTTKAGDVVLKAMDRDSMESRTWRLDRIEAYTVHRTAYVVDRPELDTSSLGIKVTVNTPDAVICRELAREDLAYWSDRFDRYDSEPEYEYDAA